MSNFLQPKKKKKKKMQHDHKHFPYWFLLAFTHVSTNFKMAEKNPLQPVLVPVEII